MSRILMQQLLLMLLLILIFHSRPCSSTTAVRYLLPISDDDAGPKCIDGSPGSYYLRIGAQQFDGTAQRRWLINFEGGGWCWDVESCLSRSATKRGSTLFNSERIESDSKSLRGYMSNDPNENRLFHDWNLVYVSYCDGSSFAGDRRINYKGHKLHFNGKAIRDSVLHQLLSKHEMKQADMVIIAGHSAGALGVFLGIDEMAAQIKAVNPSALVAGLPESGFFLPYTSKGYAVPLEHDALGPHHPDASINGILDFQNGIRNVFTFTNMGAGTNRRCLEAPEMVGNASTTSSISFDEAVLSTGEILPVASGANCVFPVNMIKYLATSVFVLQSRYDAWQLPHEVSNEFSVAEANQYGALLAENLHSSLFYPNNPLHGAFLDSCYGHGQACAQQNYWSGSELSATSGNHLTVHDAVAKWLSGLSHPPYHRHPDMFYYEQKHLYPCRECCPICPVLIDGAVQK